MNKVGGKDAPVKEQGLRAQSLVTIKVSREARRLLKTRAAAAGMTLIDYVDWLLRQSYRP